MSVRTIICPRCGEWMDETHPDFPNCVYCGEKLTQCGFCRAFPGDGNPCPKAKGHPIVYASSILNCSHFSPKFVVRRTHLSPLTSWQIVASMMFTLSVLVIAFLSRPVPPKVLLSAVAPPIVIAGDPLEIRMLVKAASNQPIKLRLDRRLLMTFQLVGISPLPIGVKQYGQLYEFVLPVSSDPQPVTVKFKSTRTGEYAVKAIVMTAQENQAEWQAKVKVVKRGSPTKPTEGLAVIAMALWR